MNASGWSQPMFDAFKAATGIRRRLLLDQLVRANEPLAKRILGQIIGITDDRVGPNAKCFQGKIKVLGAQKVEWDDLMQAARIGLAEAIERLDPAKGKLSGIARWRILHNVQMAYKRHDFVRAPDGREQERPAVTFVDDQEALDRMSLEHADPFAELDDVSAEQVAECVRTGDWPETMGEWRERFVPRVRVAVPEALPVDPMVAFLARCKFAYSKRSTEAELWNAYRLECRVNGKPELSRPALMRELRARDGVRDIRVRTPRNPGERGLAGVAILTQAGEPTAIRARLSSRGQSVVETVC